MDKTPTERLEATRAAVTLVADTVSELGLEFDDLYDYMNVGQLVRLAEWCSELKKLISLIERDATKKVADLVPRDTRVTEWADASGRYFRTEVRFRSVRTAVDKNGLYDAVKKTSRNVDEATGELVLDYKSMVESIEKAFRFEPRWTEIKQLGIDPDEYCQTRYEPQVETVPLDASND